MTSAIPRLDTRLKMLSRAASVAAIAVGGLVLIGWVADIAAFQRVFLWSASMQASTAFALVLSGIALWIRQRERLAAPLQWIVYLCAATVVAAGVWGTLAGSMLPATGFAVVLIGSALLLFDYKTRRGYRPVTHLTIAAVAVALLPAVSRLYGAEGLDGTAQTLMPGHSALSVLVLCAGLLSARPRCSLMGLLTGDSVGGMLLRRLLPVGVIGPLTMGWLAIQGLPWGYHQTAFGISLFSWFSVVLLAGVALWSAQLVNRIDEDRRNVERQHATILDVTPEAVIAVDESQRMVLFNKGAEEIFGWRAEQAIGRPIDLLLPPRLAEAHREHVGSFGTSPERARRMGERREVSGRRKDGTEFPAEASISKLIDGDRKTFTVILRDISDRKRVEGQLRESEQRFREIAEHIREVFWIGEPDVNRIVYVSPVYEDIWGRTCQSLYDDPRSWVDAIHLDDRERMAAVRRQPARPYHQEYRIVRPDGTIRWVRDRAFPVRDDAGRVVRLAGIVEDITEQQAQKAVLEYQARHDPLTGLPNRVLLHERLREAIESVETQGRSLALLLLDLDRFKEINDTLGHHRGDLLLQQIGPRLRNVLHDKDLVARLGGDEFAVILPLAESRHASDVAAKITKALEPPFVIEGLPIVVEASIGIAVCPDHGTSPELIMQRADVAMYRTKQTGGYVIYDPQQDHHSPRRLALLGELRHAIEHDELVLHYQPKVDVKTRSVVGLEALVRWKHPYRGMIPPDQFIGPAEQTGLIKPLTLWVLRAAKRHYAEWRAAGVNLPVSVNLSARHLHDTIFPAHMEDLLRTGGPQLNWIELEITESAIMADLERALETCTQLKALGIRLSIDDFGIGYSSLGYLRRLPIETIKIDKSFIMNMTHHANDVAIVRATIDMAHSLGLKVVAEGIENQEVWDMLSGMGCDSAQGYYLSRPMPASEVERWLRTSTWGIKSVPPSRPQ